MSMGHVLAFGTFDGLHKGHTAVLNAALSFKDLTPVVVTFDEPPKRKTSGFFVPMLMSAEKKLQLLKEMGFKEIFILDYDEIHDVSPKAFLDMLFEKYNVKAAVCGFNYRFGCGGSGDAAFICDYCQANGAEAVVVPATEFSGQPISSSLIRELIADGNISFANMLLSRPFSFASEVIHGDERGREMGFPTANQNLDGNLVIPKLGVYSTVAQVDGKKYPAVTNIGIRPTFLLKRPISETHIIGFEDDIYGKIVEISLIDFLRPEKQFSGLDELKAAIDSDKEKAIKNFSKI